MTFNPIKWWRNRRCFVILDPRDNSVTFSRALFERIRGVYGSDDTPPKVFMFLTPANGCYGFTINPDLGRPTQLADIQYNARHKCIGFESLNPAVTRILYDYGITSYHRPRRFPVSVQIAPPGRLYFQSERKE